MFPKYGGTTRFDKVEVTIPNSYTKAFMPFNDQPQLRSDNDYDIAIQAIETYTQFDQPLSQSGIVMPTPAQLIATRLILYINGEQSGFEFALTQLHRCIAVDGSGDIVPHVRDLQLLNNLSVSWEKCQLFNPAPNGWNTGGSGEFSFEFGVHYLRLPPGTLKKINDVTMANYTKFANG